MNRYYSPKLLNSNFAGTAFFFSVMRDINVGYDTNNIPLIFDL